MQNINPPSHFDAKRLLSDTLKFGDREKIALLCDLSPSLISQQCSTESEKHSYYGCFALFLWAVSRVNPDAALAIMDDLTASFQEWVRQSTPSTDSAAHLTGLIGKEYAEFIEVEGDNRPIAVQRKELRDIRRAVDRKEAHLNQLEKKTLRSA
jgi:hypothetical protein